MTLYLDKLNPKFRQLADLLLFSDRMDLDLSEFKKLLKENYEINFPYLWDRFTKSSEIAWEDGQQFWGNRLSFLLSLNEKTLSKYIEDHLEKRIFSLIKNNQEINIKYDIEYLQFLEFCRIKRNRQESLASFQNYLAELPAQINLDKLIIIINSFIPVVFSNINEFTDMISKKITHSTRSFELLVALERQGIIFDKQPIVKLARNIIVERSHNEKNCRAFFTIINNSELRNRLKDEYKPSNRSKLIDLLDSCDYLMIEENHLRNIKNVIDLDPSVADELSVIYADKLYCRSIGHKKANADRLIRLLKSIPQIMPKKILAYLSSTNKMSDIKYVLSAFPDLKKLAAFV